jgi:hypothetical protein
MSAFDLTCGYCLRVLSTKHTLEKHLDTCREKMKHNYETRIHELEIALAKLEKETTQPVKKRMSIGDELIPLPVDFYQTLAEKLTVEHIKNGVDGYVQLALENGLGKSVACTSVERKRFVVKRSDNTVYIDQGGVNMFKELCIAVRTKSIELLKKFLVELVTDESPDTKLGEKCSCMIGSIIDVAEGKKIKTPMYTSFTRSVGLSTYCSR